LSAASVGRSQPETGLAVTKFIFKSAHGILKGGPDNFASDGTYNYSTRWNDNNRWHPNILKEPFTEAVIRDIGQGGSH
jgi:hypothetical protein